MFIAAGMSATSQVHGENQNIYSMPLENVTWKFSTLSILLVTPNNEPWWNPAYVNDTVRAIGQWNEAIQYFAADDSAFSYLSGLKYVPTVSNASEPGFDIYLNWTEGPNGSGSDDLGLTLLTSQANVVTNCSMLLSTHSLHDVSLNDGDMQNVALHELGHGLGLGESYNLTSDPMYISYSLENPPRLVTTLDVYAVSTVFAWMQPSVVFNPVDQWLPSSPVILPSNIPYEGLPVSSQYADPQSLANNPVVETLVLVYELLIHPDILAAVIVFVLVLAIIAVYPTKKKDKSQVSSSKK